VSLPDYAIVIPARYNSSRFPGKPLVEIAGKPMLEHVHECAAQTAAKQIIVATDDDRIFAFCQKKKMQVVMTSDQHPSGTDRIAEVAASQNWHEDDIVVGLQGDEPATAPAVLDQLAANIAKRPAADIATLCSPISTPEDYHDTDRVKVVFDDSGYALYFSRAAIPHRREPSASDPLPSAYVHIGLYAYRCRFLQVYRTLKPHVLEQEERLEQLRALAYGYRIHVAVSEGVHAHGVDRPEDIATIEKILLDGKTA